MEQVVVLASPSSFVFSTTQAVAHAVTASDAFSGAPAVTRATSIASANANCGKGLLLGIAVMH